jgi:DNA-binding CsgD family transcriptional regulator
LLAFCGELQQARTFLEEALDLARRQHDAAGIVRSLIYLGVCPVFAGSSPDLAHLREGLGRARTLGLRDLLGVSLFYLAMAEQAQGNSGSAAVHYAEALDVLDPVGDIHVAAGIRFGLGAILGGQGDIPGAVQHIGAGITASVTLRDRWLLSQGTRAALSVLGENADPSEAARLLGAVDALRQATGSGRVVWEQEPRDEGWPEVREHLSQGEWAVNYLEGRSLSAGEVAALTSRLLSDFARNRFVDRPSTGVDRSRHVTRTSAAPQDSKSCSEHLLTERECQVLRLVAEGLSSKAIGHQLFISSRTVSQHLTSIFNKLGANTRAQAVAVAQRRGFI